MLFHAPEFVFGFLPLTVIVFFLVAHAGSNQAAIAWLVVMSLVFYAWGTAAHLLLIAGSVVFNYVFGVAIRRQVASDRTAAIGRHLTALGVVANLLLLGVFKYYDFFVANLNALSGTEITMQRLILPLAISFFTLQQIAYLVDVYRGRAQEPSFLHYCLFVTFFPQLIAGPIVHHSEMLPQFRREGAFRFHADDFAEGLTIFLLGLFKKAVIADAMADFADPVFAAVDGGETPSFYAAWAATLAFSFQIYFDFSAYSDMAIGLARMFSIRLPMNFESPYRAAGIIEFWRRWHMTLSRFLRDYLYIPLGGNRQGRPRRYGNLMLTMLIGGLWHGAAWTFVVWGGLHGLYLIVNHVWRYLRVRLTGRETGDGLAGRYVGTAVTFLAVSVAWVFFRAQTFDGAVRMLEGMAGIHGAPLPSQLVEAVPALSWIATSSGGVPLLAGGSLIGFIELCGLLALAGGVAFLGQNLHHMKQTHRIILLVPTVVFALQRVLVGDATEFIYFRF